MRRDVLTVMLSAAAITSALPSAAKDRKPRDPNEMVCENEEVLGSRLATRRICMTRAQWAEKRRDDRAAIDRSQTQKCVAMGGACTGE